LLRPALICLLAFLVSAPTAGAADPIASITVVPPVTLNSDGSVTVTVTATCVPLDEYKGLPPLAEIIITQGSGQAAVRGTGAAVAVCDNTPHLYEIRLVADEPSARFHRGLASVVAVISACGFLNQELVCEQQDPPAHSERVIVRGTGAAG
jgi:hypothetical protein